MPDRDPFADALAESGVSIDDDVPAPNAPDEFAAALKESGVELEPLEAKPAIKRQAGTGNMLLDGLLGLTEGATLNNAGEIGNARTNTVLGAVPFAGPALQTVAKALGLSDVDVGTALADLLQTSRTRDGQAPTYAGRRGVDADELVERAMETGAGKVGYGVGIAAPAIASGFAAPAAVGTQAAVGAVQGALASGGESDYDPLATLTGAATGGLIGGAGGAAAKHLAGRATLGGVPTTGTNADQLMQSLASGAQKLGGQAAVGAGVGAVTSGSTNPWEILKGAGKGAATAATLGRLGGLAPKAAPLLGPAVRGLGSAAAPIASELAGRVSNAKAQAADVAYGTAPTMSWAVQSVLTSGNAGLDPDDEQRLTEALLSGDEDRLISANFALQQRSPMYAARLRRELESLQEEF